MRSQLLLQAEIGRLQRALEEWEDPQAGLTPQAGLWITRDGHIVALNDENQAFILRTEEDYPLPFTYLVNEKGEYHGARHINQRGLDLVRPLNLLD